MPAGAQLMGQLVESDWLWRCWVSRLPAGACVCMHNRASPFRAVGSLLQEASLFAQHAPVMRHRLARAAQPEGQDCQYSCSTICARLLCIGQPQDLPGAEAGVLGGCGPRLAPPGYAASPEPRALHLDPLHARLQPGLAQRADSHGSHPEPNIGLAHAALRALSAPFQIFEFDFAAPPPGGRSTQMQVNPSACSNGIHAVYTAAYGRLAGDLGMHECQTVASALPAPRT